MIACLVAVAENKARVARWTGPVRWSREHATGTDPSVPLCLRGESLRSSPYITPMSDKPLDKTGQRSPTHAPSSSGEVEAFLRKAAAAPKPHRGRKGRLVFGLDATASREPTWDVAVSLQAEMFETAARLGGLEMQLAYYRSLSECRASPWVADGRALVGPMTRMRCQAGRTQLVRLLRHAVTEAEAGQVDALVFVGDSFEESLDEAAHQAGQLSLRGVPVFVFHEGEDPRAARAFEEIARLTKGACCRFDAGAADQLRALLKAVAVYAAGGPPALADHARREGGMALRLTDRLAGQR